MPVLAQQAPHTEGLRLQGLPLMALDTPCQGQGASVSGLLGISLPASGMAAFSLCVSSSEEA